MRIDHVIYATADLAAAAARIEREHRLEVAPGGKHRGLGTHNMVVPLGGGYLELLAIAEPDSTSPVVEALARRLEEHGEGLWAWVVQVEDVAPVAAARDTPILTVAREDLTAQVAGLPEALREPYLPFFIARDQGIPDPGATGDAGGITWVQVAGDAARLQEWLGEHDLPLRVTPGTAGVVAIGVGDRELRG